MNDNTEITTTMRAIARAAAAISQTDPTAWNAWLILLLKHLEGHNSAGYDFAGILMQLRSDIENRLEDESW